MKIFYIPKHTNTNRQTILKNIRATIKFISTETKWYILWCVHRIKWIKNITVNNYNYIINYSVKALDKYDKIIDNIFIK